MTGSEKRELVRLLEYRALSDFERKRRRLLAIPVDVAAEALIRAVRDYRLRQSNTLPSIADFPQKASAKHERMATED